MLSPDQDAALKDLHRRDGISPSEATRRALSDFLIRKGVLKKAKTKG
jgi:ribosomal protein S15P/S13E